ncbi:MAG: hypothetical protein NTY12_01095 [Candidatus Falkowbacteria bacterium]|nr:hypothetical protein [Candidatus Falkowbacteria bacterium]
MTKLVKRLRLYWIIALGLLLVWLLGQAIVPWGKITYQTDFKDQSYFIGKLSPAERVTESNSGQKIIAEPVYFSLFTPRPFSKATVTLEFSNPPNTLELGVRQDKTVWNFNLKPVYSKLLESLRLDKKTIVEGDNLLWQKEKTFSSLADFNKKQPANNKIMVYNYLLANNYKLESAALLAQDRVVPINLRGAWQLYTYSQGQAIKIDFYVKDRNENSDPDTVEVNLYQGNKIIATASLVDDTKNDGTERILSLKTKNLSAGIYRLEYKANNDIVTTQIKTAQAKLAFPGSLWLAENDNKNINLYTDSQSINIQTNNPRSRQNIKFDNSEYSLASTYKQYNFSNKDFSSRIKAINFKNGDLTIASNSLLAFSEADYFNPLINQLPRNATDTNLGADYIVANYKPAKKLANGNWEVALDFDLSAAYREKNKYSLMLSAPQLDSQTSDFVVKNIRVDLAEPNLWQYISKMFQKL